MWSLLSKLDQLLNYVGDLLLASFMAIPCQLHVQQHDCKLLFRTVILCQTQLVNESPILVFTISTRVLFDTPKFSSISSPYPALGGVPPDSSSNSPRSTFGPCPISLSSGTAPQQRQALQSGVVVVARLVDLVLDMDLVNPLLIAYASSVHLFCRSAACPHDDPSLLSRFCHGKPCCDPVAQVLSH